MALAFLVLPTNPASAQPGDFLTQDRVEKDDGRFIARIANHNAEAASNGFIDAIYLVVEWWGLLGQPVEQYGIRWDMGSDISIPDGEGGYHQLYLPDLDQYPDLKERFMDLRPVDLHLTVDVTLYEPSGMIADPQYPDEQPNYYSHSDFATATKHVRRSPHLMIARSGKAGEDFLPSSPQSWSQFLEWTGGSIVSGDDPDQKARNTLRRTYTITFNSPRIAKIQLPEAQMRAIYDEYRRRIADKEAEEAAMEEAAEKRMAEQIAREEAEDKLNEKVEELFPTRSAEEKLAEKLAEIEQAKARAAFEAQVEKEIELARNSGNEYLGAEEASGDHVEIFYRDHGSEDGDRVRLFVNDTIVERSVRLRNRGDTSRIPLQKGVNRIRFLSLDGGYRPPNTAEFEVRDADGDVLMHREWSIDEGYEATLLVLRR